MYNPKIEITKSIISSLKIDNNPFNISTIEDAVADIPQSSYKEFYSALFGADHQYLNSMDRVIKVAKIFAGAKTYFDTKAEARALEKEFFKHGQVLRHDAEDQKVANNYFYKNIKLKLSDMRKDMIYKEFGGTEAIMKMNLAENADTNINKIYNIIKKVDKMIKDPDYAIENKRVKMLFSPKPIYYNEPQGNEI